MFSSRSFIIFLVVPFLTLIECVASAPQYFDSCFYPVPVKGNLMYLTPNRGQDVYVMRGNYPASFYPVNYPGVNPWFGPDYPVDMSLVPPVREESEFMFVKPEFESGGIGGLHRGRSDIDPVEDNEGLGYFYPKPKIAFDLPNFTPLGDADEVPRDEATAATTAEDTTDKITTVSPPETSPVKV